MARKKRAKAKNPSSASSNLSATVPQNKDKGRDEHNLHPIPATADDQNPSIRPHGGQPTCFRITGIPFHWDTNVLEQKLQKIDPDIDLANVELSVFRACSNLKANVALLRMKKNTTYFEGWKPSDEKEAIFCEHGRNVQLHIDKHFYGLTPLNNPNEPITAEFVPLQSSTLGSGY
jgi:hypothetical protein